MKEIAQVMDEQEFTKIFVRCAEAADECTDYNLKRAALIGCVTAIPDRVFSGKQLEEIFKLGFPRKD